MAIQLLSTVLINLGTVLADAALLIVGRVAARPRSNPRPLGIPRSPVVNALALTLCLAVLVPSKAFAGDLIDFTQTPTTIITTINGDDGRGSMITNPSSTVSIVTLEPPLGYLPPNGGSVSWGGNTIMEPGGGVLATLTEVPTFYPNFVTQYFTVTFTVYPMSNGPNLGNDILATYADQAAIDSNIEWYNASNVLVAEDMFTFKVLPEVSSVPEPTSLVMMATSVLAVLGYARRRRRSIAFCRV